MSQYERGERNRLYEKMETCNVMKIGLVRAREEVGEKRRERPREALERISSLFFFFAFPFAAKFVSYSPPKGSTAADCTRIEPISALRRRPEGLEGGKGGRQQFWGGEREERSPALASRGHLDMATAKREVGSRVGQGAGRAQRQEQARVWTRKLTAFLPFAISSFHPPPSPLPLDSPRPVSLDRPNETTRATSSERWDVVS